MGLVAKRSIKAGEEVTDNYGIHHLSFSLEERQEKLHKGFKFCCWCEGCQKDFPRMKSLRTQLPDDVEDRFDKLREEIMELFRKNKLAECKQMSLDMVKILEKAVIPHPHRLQKRGRQTLINFSIAYFSNIYHISSYHISYIMY